MIVDICTNKTLMKIVAVIPARLNASRFPGKLLQPLGDAPVIVQTYKAALKTQLFDQVWVATDSDAIEELILGVGGKVFRSQKEHSCGSDRIAEAVADLDAELIINVQGDEPFIDTQSLTQLIQVFQGDLNSSIDMASLMIPITDPEEIQNPNAVKVIVDRKSFALYFSRAALPFVRRPENATTVYRHIGIYAFRKATLMAFASSAPTPLEEAEQIECIRHLEYGKKIKMVQTDNQTIGIDTPEDLLRAQKIWSHSSDTP